MGKNKPVFQQIQKIWKRNTLFREVSCNHLRAFNLSSAASFFKNLFDLSWTSLMAQLVKNLHALWRPGFNPWVGKFPWRRKCNPFQYSCLESSMDRGAWWATVHEVAKSLTRLSDSHFLSLSLSLSHTHTHTHTHQEQQQQHSDLSFKDLLLSLNTPAPLFLCLRALAVFPTPLPAC